MHTTGSSDVNPAGLIADIAIHEIGQREEGGNNRGSKIVEYQRATWLHPDAWPWCAAFTAWVLKQWLRDDKIQKLLELDTPEEIEHWRCRDASAYGWEKWAMRRRLLVFDESARANRGDFVTFDFSHIGIVVADNVDIIETVEGNTNGRGNRDSEFGDGVWRKRRPRALVKSFIRILP